MNHIKPTDKHTTRNTTWALRKDTRNVRNSISVMRALGPRTFALGVVLAGAAAALAPIAGGHAEADVGSIFVTDASGCDQDWLGADLPYVGVMIHNPNPFDPTPVDVLTYDQGQLTSTVPFVVTTDVAAGFNPLVTNSGRVEVRDPATSDLLFTTGDLMPCAGPVDGEIDPDDPAEATLPLIVNPIHFCGSTNVIAGVSIHNPSSTDAVVGVSLVTKSGSSSSAIAVPAGAIVDKTTLLSYGSIIRVTVVQDGVTLLDTGERVSFSEDECNQSAPPLGEGLSFDLAVDCSGQIPAYKLAITNSAGPNEPAPVNIYRWIGQNSTNGTVDTIPGGQTKTYVQEAAFGTTLRQIVQDQFGRQVYDSGLLVAMTADECGVSAIHLVELDLDIECVGDSPVATTVVTNAGHFTEGRTVQTTVNGVSSQKVHSIVAGASVTDSFAVNAGDLVRFRFYSADPMADDEAIELTAPSCTETPADPPVPTTPDTTTPTTDPAPVVTEPAPVVADAGPTTTVPETTVVPDSTVAPTVDGADTQSAAPAPTGDSAPVQVPVVSGELPSTGGGWTTLTALATALLSAGLTIARLARRGGYR